MVLHAGAPQAEKYRMVVLGNFLDPGRGLCSDDCCVHPGRR